MSHLRTTAPGLGGLPRRWYTPFAITLFGVLVALATVIVPARASAAGATALTGTLQLTPGSCGGGKVTGSYLRMVLPSGGSNGPYMSNSDSSCPDQTITPLAPGTDGGLRVGSYQPTPSPAFSASGDAKARRITAPAQFYGTSFATATSKVDPQTRTAVPAPTLTLTGRTLNADLRAFAVTWNNQNFNQGAPKPNGSTPGNTRRATGTYDAATGAFTLSWASQVVGGPFDKFTGSWHFEGRFVPDSSTAPAGGHGGGAGTVPGASAGSPGTVTGGSTGTLVPGAPGAPGAPAAGAGARVPGAAAGAAAGAAVAAGQPAVATTQVVTTEKWKVSVPVLGLAVGIALLAIGGLILSSVLSRRSDAP